MQGKKCAMMDLDRQHIYVILVLPNSDNMINFSFVPGTRNAFFPRPVIGMIRYSSYMGVLPCHTSCSSCDPQNSTDTGCTSCADPNHKVYSNGRCGVCDTNNGYYIDGPQCKRCAQYCSQCTGPSLSDCTSCGSNFTNQSPTGCACTGNKYPNPSPPPYTECYGEPLCNLLLLPGDPSKSACLLCNSRCATCNGPSQS